MRAGNDGRRPSGVVWQRTKYRHYHQEGSFVTLCNRTIGNLESDRHPELPICKTCAKRLGATHANPS